MSSFQPLDVKAGDIVSFKEELNERGIFLILDDGGYNFYIIDHRVSQFVKKKYYNNHPSWNKYVHKIIYRANRSGK